MFTLDTNILIYYAAGNKKVGSFVVDKIKNNISLIIPTVVVAEFLSFPSFKPREQKLFSRLLHQLEIAPLTFDIAEKAGFLRRKYKLRLADAVIAATAICTKSTLVTQNLKHFKKIKELKAKSI